MKRYRTPECLLISADVQDLLTASQPTGFDVVEKLDGFQDEMNF